MDPKLDKDGNPIDEGNAGVDLEALASTVEGLVTAVGGISSNMETLTGSLQQMSTTMQTPAATGVDNDEDDDFDPASLEGMSRGDFANHMVGMFEKVVKSAVKPLGERIENVSTTSNQERIAGMVADARSNNADFDEWLPEIKSLVNESPGLSLKRAIGIARGENPDKAKEMATKHNMEAGGDDTVSAIDKGSKGFGGLSPKASQTTTSTRMEKDEASEAAWDSALGVLDDPDLLTGTQ